MINVIIADDHKIVVDGLVSILEAEKNINVVGTALNGQQVINLLRTLKFDIAILDVEMPDMTGVQLSNYIKEHYPEIKILILTMYKSKEFISQIISAGAKGYILKNRGGEELVKAIYTIYEGKSFIGQEVTDILLEALQTKMKKEKISQIKLTRREKEVLKLIIKGLTSKQIGQELHIAPATVDTHRRNLIDKTNVANSRELISFAIENKII